MRYKTPHDCPHCKCHWETIEGLGLVNRSAPGYALVRLIEDHMSGKLAPEPSGDGTAPTARPPARPTEEVRR